MMVVTATTTMSMSTMSLTVTTSVTIINSNLIDPAAGARSTR